MKPSSHRSMSWWFYDVRAMGIMAKKGSSKVKSFTVRTIKKHIIMKMQKRLIVAPSDVLYLLFYLNVS